MDECPVCLEPLLGTVVHLGCCKKQVHIQCYIPKCPLCRADLPTPPNHPPQHVIVPVPVQFQPQPISKWRIFLGNFAIISISTGACLFIIYSR